MDKILFLPLNFDNYIDSKILKHNILSLLYMLSFDKVIFLSNKSNYKLINDIIYLYTNYFDDQLNFNIVNIQYIYDLNYIMSRFEYKLDEHLNDDILIDCTYTTDLFEMASILISNNYKLTIQKNMYAINISNIIYDKNVVNDLKRLKRLFNINSFFIMHKILKSNKNNKLNNYHQKLFENLAQDYYNWDNFNYDLISGRRYSLDFPEYKEQFLSNNRGLQKINDPKDSRHFIYVIADMLNNAIRRFNEYKYNDAVLRLYKTLDLIAHAQLYEQYGINKANVDINHLSKLGLKRRYINKIENQHRLRTTNKEIQINLTEGYFLLYRLKDGIGKYYYKNIELFTRLNTIRNKSILTHGKESLSYEDYKEYESVTLELARLYNKDIEKYMNEISFPTFSL